MTLRPWLHCVRKVLGISAHGHSRRRQQAVPYAAELEQFETRQLLSAVTAIAGDVSKNVLESKVIAFDVTTTGTLSYNLSTGGYSAKIELPGGMTLDATALKTLMSGQLAVPKINPGQAAGSLGGLETSVSSNYKQVRDDLIKTHGGGNVYLSTEHFTDWASPENAANTIGAAVITGGSTTSQIIQEAKDVVLGELGNLYTWLQNKAPKEAEAAIAAVLKGIVTGQDVTSPFLAVKFLNINQTYTVGLGGPAAAIADGLGAGNTSQSVTSVHKGFAVIWKGSGESLTSLRNSLTKFEGASMSGKDGFFGMLGQLANRPELKGLGKLADAILTTNTSALIEQLVITKLSAALGVTQSQLRQAYQPGNPIIDLRATQLDEQLNGVLGNLAAGNEGSTKVTRLDFNLNTYEVTAEVTIRHRHSWGSVSEILNAVGKRVGQWADKAENFVRQSLDTAGNTIRELTYKAADKVTEIFDKAGAMISKTIVNSAGFKVLEATWSNGTKTLERVRDSVGTLVSEYSRDGIKEFRTLYTAGVRTAYTVWENGINTVHNVYNTSNQLLSKFWRDGAKEISQGFINGKLATEKIVQNGIRIADNAWKDGVKTLNVVRDTAGKLVSEYWRDGSTEYRKLYTNGIRTAYTVWEKSINTVHDVYNTSGQFVTRFWRDGTKEISQWFTNGKVTAENIAQNGVTIAKKAWADGINTLNVVRDTAGKLVSEYWRDGSKEFRKLYTDGIRTSYTVWENNLNTIHYVWNTSGQKVSEYWRDGAKEFKNVYQGGVRVAQNVWENGKNIAQHVWNTSGTYIGNALSNAGSAANNVLNSLGIKL